MFGPLSASSMDLNTSSWTTLNLKPRAQDYYDRRARQLDLIVIRYVLTFAVTRGEKPLSLRYLVSFEKMYALGIRKLAFLRLCRLHTLTDWSQKKYEYFVRPKHHLAYYKTVYETYIMQGLHCIVHFVAGKASDTIWHDRYSLSFECSLFNRSQSCCGGRRPQMNTYHP